MAEPLKGLLPPTAVCCVQWAGLRNLHRKNNQNFLLFVEICLVLAEYNREYNTIRYCGEDCFCIWGAYIHREDLLYAARGTESTSLAALRKGTISVRMYRKHVGGRLVQRCWYRGNRKALSSPGRNVLLYSMKRVRELYGFKENFMKIYNSLKELMYTYFREDLRVYTM